MTDQRRENIARAMWEAGSDFSWTYLASDRQAEYRRLADAAIAADDLRGAEDEYGCPIAIHHAVDCPGDRCRYAVDALSALRSAEPSTGSHLDPANQVATREDR